MKLHYTQLKLYVNIMVISVYTHFWGLAVHFIHPLVTDSYFGSVLIKRNPLLCSLFVTIHIGLLHMWNDNKVRELIMVEELHTSLLNTFKVLPLGSYSPMPAPSPPFNTILELVLWNGLQSCHCITPDVINVIKMPTFQYFLHLWEQKKSLGARSGE